MKAPASISVGSSLVLAAFASVGTLWSATNESSSIPAAIVTVAKEVGGRSQIQPSNPGLSRGSSEIVQLTQAGMDEAVIVSFISGSSLFELSPDQIIYLSDIGVSNRVIQAMLAHDQERLGNLVQVTNVSNMSMPLESAPAVALQKLSPVNVARTSAEALGQNVQSQSITQISPIVTKQDVPKSENLSAIRTVPAKKKVFYPVREPYPVELTAPIVMLDAPTF